MENNYFDIAALKVWNIIKSISKSISIMFSYDNTIIKFA